MGRTGSAQAKGGGFGRQDGPGGDKALSSLVYKKLLDVPPGYITTYGDLARAVGLAGGQRAIGRIMNKNPHPSLVPCHRVVNSDGRLGGYAYGPDVKENMLSREGLKITGGRLENFEKIRYRF